MSNLSGQPYALKFIGRTNSFLPMNLSKTKKAFLLLGVLMLVFVVLNAGYFWANLSYIVHGRKTIYKAPGQGSPTKQASQNAGAKDQLSIPALNITAPIVYINEANEKTYQAALKNGVVHFPGTAGPGEVGNDYIFGHSSDYIWSSGHYKTVFAVLPSIRIGDEIVITASDGSTFSYSVINSRVVAANDVSVLSQDTKGKKLLTLQTSYPVGTALKRWVVVGELQP